jgi:hypothetical protein
MPLKRLERRLLELFSDDLTVALDFLIFQVKHKNIIIMCKNNINPTPTRHYTSNVQNKRDVVNHTFQL